MTGKAVTTIDDPPPQLPAECQAFFDKEANVLPKETVPSLSYEGKVWTISLQGEKTKLMVRDPQTGDDSPVPVFRCVILDYNKRRGRAYYEGTYDPTKAAMPACWSDDGITPSQYIKQKKSPKCADCPLSVRGSKITDSGDAVTACSEHRMVVLVPSGRLDYEPLRMKIAITSDFDGRSPDHVAQGWYAFKNYVDMLRAKGVQHTAQLVTKMKFDPNKTYPKVLFAQDKWLDEEQVKAIIPVVKSEKVSKLVSGAWTPNGVDGEPVDTLETADMPAAKATTTAATAKPAAPPPKELTAKEKTIVAAKAAAATAAKALAEAEAVGDGEEAGAAAETEEGEITLPGTTTTAGKGNRQTVPKAAATKTTTAAKSPDVGDDNQLNALLKVWG